MKKDQAVCSVREYLEEVWRTPALPNTEIVLLRGQLHSHPLLPKLFRGPNSPEGVQHVEARMLAFLKEAAPHLAPSRPSNDWDWLSLGQHYGMSTRMSDWSANPLIALFFAVERDPTPEENPLVYHYPINPDRVERMKEKSPLAIRHTCVTRSTHSHRSEVQAAWNVVHAIHHMTDGSFEFIPLANMLPHNERITEIFISKQHVPAVRDELAQMGLTHATLYGDFGSVCRSIAPFFGIA